MFDSRMGHHWRRRKGTVGACRHACTVVFSEDATTRLVIVSSSDDLAHLALVLVAQPQVADFAPQAES